ncbi:hypothetical protein EV356DRAFT_263254 [Viridothelium virens]|uniref:Uncharacterized protein n=1 Tax=Viridothelium virens TaxID=1048519 RepID=A0A6A6HKV5_VIRVR|nr:hypothetical protein EV356DRAFT_263254 [Viridothelium virens]
MPIRWSIENDRRLLLTVLKTHKVAIDSVKVAAQWPDDDDSSPRPTWRAVSERLVKLRSTFNYTHEDFNVTKTGPDGPKRETRGRPRKPINNSASTAGTSIKTETASGSGTTPSSGNKRKRFKKEEPPDSDDDEFISPHVSAAEARALGLSSPGFHNTDGLGASSGAAANRDPFSTPPRRPVSKTMAGTPSSATAATSTPTPVSKRRRGGSAAAAAPTAKAEGLRAPSVGDWDFVDGLDAEVGGIPLDGSGMGMMGGLEDYEVDFYGGFGSGAGVGGVGGASSSLSVERQERGATTNDGGRGGVAAASQVKAESERSEYQDDGLGMFY